MKVVSVSCNHTFNLSTTPYVRLVHVLCADDFHAQLVHTGSVNMPLMMQKSFTFSIC